MEEEQEVEKEEEQEVLLTETGGGAQTVVQTLHPSASLLFRLVLGRVQQL